MDTVETEVTDLALPGNRVLRVRRWPGQAPPLVLLHGFLDSSEGWRALAATSRRQCFAFDLPGFGGSTAVRWPRVTAYAETVREGMDGLGIGRAVVVGHSFGGAVAARLAARHPDRVDSLALIAPVGFGPIRAAGLAGLPVVREVVAATLPWIMANPVSASIAYAAAVTRRQLPQREFLRRMALGAPGARPGARDALAALFVLNQPEKLFNGRQAYRGPVSVFWGEEDRLVPASHSTRIRHAFPQARINLWRGVAHHPQAEVPDQLEQAIESVCRSCEPPAYARTGSRVPTPLDGLAAPAARPATPIST